MYRKEETVAVSTGGHIQSPRYPGGYPRNVLLSWKLVSPLNTRIQLDFDSHFGLEEPENDVCRYDFVEVEDISESSTAIRGRWCGQKEVPPRITSKSHTVKVTFKSDDYFVVKPGFKLYYSLVDDSPPPPSETNWEAVTIPVSVSVPPFRCSYVKCLWLRPPLTPSPPPAAALDETIAAFDTVEELLRHLNPETWQEDLESIYKETGHYRPRTFHHDRKHKSKSPRGQLPESSVRSVGSRPFILRSSSVVDAALFAPSCTSARSVNPSRTVAVSPVDLDRLNEDVKRYSCTPRNFSVNLREELRATNAVFFPRCLLVQRCGGNCGCGTDDWHSCTCSAGKTSDKLYEVLKFSPEPSTSRRRSRARWVLEEIHLQHHERCDCICHSRPPR
ncbi:platelet-derived growth factor D-like [Scleropages formosus]|uniref:Platelet-derived growth factor D n=1 Tax=Scleropages formosus TaxID=113540 RepID=A0A0P7VFS3_SCLFO|nr:platelet-derived growth factor D-like [Scleropages formosus]